MIVMPSEVSLLYSFVLVILFFPHMKLSVALSRSDNNYDGILIGIALNQ